MSLILGCSALETVGKVASSLGGGSSDNSGVQVESEIVGGDKDSSSDVQMGDRNNADTINNVTDIPPYVLILLIVGWMMPTPARTYKYISSKFRKN